jgi:hypothetical protein
MSVPCLELNEAFDTEKELHRWLHAMQLCSVWRNRDRLVDKARHLDRSVAVRAVSDDEFRRCGDLARTLDGGWASARPNGFV